MEVNKTLILKALKDYKGFNSDAEFARFLGVGPTVLATWYKRNTFNLRKIENAFPEVNEVYLMTGQGQMLAEKEERYRSVKGQVIPLLEIPAMAGYNEDNWSVMIASSPLYTVPEVPNADFLIKVAGDSMQPKYYEGDLIACRFIKELLFFQWGKSYVLDTSQGVMVKNIYEDKDNPDNVLLVSENKEKYPPFAIPRSDIRKLALVVGSLRIRVE